MTQGQFTQEEADATRAAVVELHNALPKTKQMAYLGHLNDIMLFLAAAKKAAPSESESAT